MKTKNLFIVVLIMICTNFLTGCKKKETPEPIIPYTVGQNYGGGIVFNVDGSGQHGLISSTSDQSDSTAWYNGGNMPTHATGTGQANTDSIIKYQGPGNYAAYICDQLVLGGFSDWFLPSADEIELLYQQRNVVGGFVTSVFYWSSTEVDYNHALVCNFSNGINGPIFKSTPNYHVRAIRAF